MSTPTSNKNSQELVINWHLTEACNYSCKYCYAKWNNVSQPKELLHNPRYSSLLLQELYNFFRPGNEDNPLAQEMSWDSLRLTLAGGEPLLYLEKFLMILEQARSLGFEVSVITNASQLDRKLLNMLAPHLTWLGISLDSQELETNEHIGRTDKNGQILNIDRLARDIQATREDYPELGIKINTVVNLYNCHENLNNLITRISPDKWKIMRMLPILNSELSINNHQFTSYINRHKKHSSIIFKEDDADMRKSYLMIDPHGRFFQNKIDNRKPGYNYSHKITEVGAKSAFSEMEFDSDKFSSRYNQNRYGEAI